METIKFTATATYPKEEVLSFALSLGFVPNEDETAEDFISNYFQSKLAEVIIENIVEGIDKQFEEQKQASIMETKIGVMDNIKVDYD